MMPRRIDVFGVPARIKYVHSSDRGATHAIVTVPKRFRRAWWRWKGPLDGSGPICGEWHGRYALRDGESRNGEFCTICETRIYRDLKSLAEKPPYWDANRAARA